MSSHRQQRRRAVRSRAAMIAAPLSVVATLSAVSAGVLAVGHEQKPTIQASINAADLTAGPQVDDSDRRIVSRGADRTELAVVTAHVQRWTTTALDVWTAAGDGARQVGELDPSTKVLITGRSEQGRDEIVFRGVSRWVTSGYLSEIKPLAAAAGLSTAPCPDGSVENGLTSAAVLVYRAVCHAFPQITTYGGWDAHGEHSSGRALDIMTSDVALGTAIADYLRSNASALNLFDVIWRQHIWTPVRAAEGWRFMPDRGSATANHYDHVHVSVN